MFFFCFHFKINEKVTISKINNFLSKKKRRRIVEKNEHSFHSKRTYNTTLAFSRYPR